MKLAQLQQAVQYALEQALDGRCALNKPNSDWKYDSEEYYQWQLQQLKDIKSTLDDFELLNERRSVHELDVKICFDN